MDTSLKKLGELECGDQGLIVRVGGPEEVLRRFLEMGFVEGNEVTVLHEAPFGGDPIAVKVRGALIALRRQEANFIEVKLEDFV